MQVIDDFINLTQGQLLVKYWFVWLPVTIIGITLAVYRLIKEW